MNNEDWKNLEHQVTHESLDTALQIIIYELKDNVGFALEITKMVNSQQLSTEQNTEWHALLEAKLRRAIATIDNLMIGVLLRRVSQDTRS
ncbi:hypothetical protein HC928_16995 [bacterium]|nr:hypothetical protein [bacterium]